MAFDSFLPQKLSRLRTHIMLEIFFGLFAIATLLPGYECVQQCSADRDSNATYAQVLILGAGMAGTAAARTLHVNGITDYIVLEATDRIGGRIRMDEAKNIELGANWIEGFDSNDPERHPMWREWLRCSEGGPEGGVSPDFSMVYDATGNPYDIVSEDGFYRRREARFEQAVEMAEELSKTADESVSVRDALTSSGWVPENSSDKIIEWRAIDFGFAVSPERLSLIHSLPQATATAFLNRDENGNIESDSEGSCYLIHDKRGYQFLVECLASDFKDTTRLKLNARVTKVETLDDCVCATVQDSTMYCAPYAVVTFSAGVLQAAIRGDSNAVQFEPNLPQDAINNITMAHYTKIFLHFEETFWHETENEQYVFGHASESRGYYPFFLSAKGIPNTLHAHVTEDLALKVVAQDEETTVNEIMAILRKIYNESIPNPVDITISQWSVDPLFLGTYEAFGPDVPIDIYDELLTPINGRLYLAGSGLNRSHSGFVHGAYGSGVYVAKQVSGDIIRSKS